MKGVAEFPACVYDRPGAASDKESVSVTPAFKSSVPVATVTYRGTDCRFSGRRCEVTTISSSCPRSSFAADALVGSARTMGAMKIEENQKKTAAPRAWEISTFSLQGRF